MMNFMKPQSGTIGMSKGIAPATSSDPWCTPRVTANMFPQYAGRTVVLIGKVLGCDPTTNGIMIQCPISGVEFTGFAEASVMMPGCNNNEFVLRLGADGQKVIVTVAPLVEEFDFGAYKGLIQLIWGNASALFH